MTAPMELRAFLDLHFAFPARTAPFHLEETGMGSAGTLAVRQRWKKVRAKCC